MTEVMSGPAPYIYVSTRMRVRKAKLIQREEYLRMLNMGLPEFTRQIEEMEYKREIDELSASFSGVDLIENAMSWNLAKEYQRVIALAPGEMKGFTRDYLHKWDIQNILTILRGKVQGISDGKIRAVLVPAGELNAPALDHLLAESSAERIIETLPQKQLAAVLSAGLAEAIGAHSFGSLENELYKYYYATLIKAARGGMKGGLPFFKYVVFEIDIKNSINLFRIRAQGKPNANTSEIWIEGGSYHTDELERLCSVANLDEVIDTLKKKIKSPVLIDALESVREKKPIYSIEGMLIAAQLNQMDNVSKRNPFSISPLLVYLERKKYEVANLRALARGKEAGLAPAVLEKYLVM
ncbi:MAG: V-type ATP synthase subunit C [Methanocalculaceae archaeon]|jgi:V/A-type H+-transporting ATPase subunit C|nr:V-type ATP synthase subunit C [Methanocalculaceae archaeon]